MGYILATLALILFIIVYMLDGLIMLFVQIKNRKWFKTVNDRKFKKAVIIDVFGNYLFKDFWNLTLSKSGDNYKFGILGETISSCLGKKRIEGSLTMVGYGISKVLDFIDFTTWKEGGHSKASIMSEEQIQNFFK
jgi:hypothetical protein